jgi:hypothetical protein
MSFYHKSCIPNLLAGEIYLLGNSKEELILLNGFSYSPSERGVTKKKIPAPEVAIPTPGHVFVLLRARVRLTLAFNSLHSNFFHTEFCSKFPIISTLKGGQGPSGSPPCQVPMPPLLQGLSLALVMCMTWQVWSMQGADPMVQRDRAPLAQDLIFFSICPVIWASGLMTHAEAIHLPIYSRTSSYAVSHCITCFGATCLTHRL